MVLGLPRLVKELNTFKERKTLLGRVGVTKKVHTHHKNESKLQNASIKTNKHMCPSFKESKCD